MQPYVVISFAAFAATQTYPYFELLDLSAKVVFIGFVTYKVISSVELTLHFIVEEYVLKDHSKLSENIDTNFKKALKVFLYSAGMIFVLDNAGMNVSSIVAGLGIGGLAIALAAQSVLGDAIASVSLFVDRPFVVGESVTINGHTGDSSFIF